MWLVVVIVVNFCGCLLVVCLNVSVNFLVVVNLFSNGYNVLKLMVNFELIMFISVLCNW